MGTMIGTLERRRNRAGATRIAAVACAAVLLVAVDASAQQRKNGGGFSVAGRRPPDIPPVIGRPLETREPLGKGQEPAFEGQTRAVAVATKTPLKIEVIAKGLRNPWSLAFLPDGKMLVTEKPGAMRIVTRDGTIGSPIEGVPKVTFGGDAGLLDVALDPSFGTNRLIYFTYVEPRDRANGVALAKAKLSDNLKRLEDLSVILRVEPNVPMPAHYGSRLLFDKEGKLFVSLAERLMSPYREQAQKLDSRLGKILRINTDGTPAPGNPFANTPGALPEIWSYGHRNPQGLTFHPRTGELWDTEHGPQAGDEVNVVVPGKNYGWPVIAYGTEYTGEAINGGLTRKGGMEQPVYYWDPAIAPSGATFYSGDLIPEWKGNLFVAALAGQHVSRLVLDGRRVVGEERLLLDQRQRMRDVRQGPDGALWVLTDDREGRLIRIAAGGRAASDTEAAQTPDRKEITINDTGASPENLTSSRDGTVFFGSTTKGTIYRALPGAARAEAWIRGDTAGLTNVLGVLADDKTNTLWVCTNAPFGRGAPAAGKTALRSFDLKTGTAKGTYPLPNGGLCNDVAIAADGTVYVSDTMGGRVLRLKPGAEALDVWAADSQLRGADGLSLLADGALYVNSYFSGTLSRIPVKADGGAGPIAVIQTSLPFSRPDGMRTSGPRTLLQVEGSGRLTEITIDGDRGEVRVIKEGLANAAGVTQVGETALVLVERTKAVAVPMAGSEAASPGGAPAPATPGRTSEAEKAGPTLEKLWETKPVLKFPEAVVFEPNGKFLYVSNVDGGPMSKDGKGSIGKIGLDGSVIEVDWVMGLDAPKGIGLYKTRLYVADLSDVVVIDVEKAAIVERIPIKGARLLHNIDIDAKGVVYVSDMFGGKVHRIEESKVSTYLENLRGPAGLLVDGTDVYVYTGEGLVKADGNKKVTTIARGLDGRANGIARVKGKEYILTSWGGVVYYVSADGSHRVLLDTRSGGIAAGINLYDPVKRVMYMTTDGHNTVIAYSLK